MGRRSCQRWWLLVGKWGEVAASTRRHAALGILVSVLRVIISAPFPSTTPVTDPNSSYVSLMCFCDFVGVP